jgi:hypothetical protein
MYRFALLAVLLAVWSVSAAAAPPVESRSLDGRGNNLDNPSWGQVGTLYSRVASPNYADGYATPVLSTINTRYVSNRIFNDTGQNLFSENGISQWGWTWGQFMDHTFGLRDERENAVDHAPIAFSKTDALEDFQNDFGAIDFFRTPAAAATGVAGAPRQQVNTVSSYIDAFNVYGGTDDRLEWLRTGVYDHSLANSGARLLTIPGNMLPRADARGDIPEAPHMDIMGGLREAPEHAVIAGDVRANENIALTATHTLFAREHNRIVGLLPAGLTAEEKFQIARRVVGAEEQYVTYHEFLPSLGVSLAPATTYKQAVNASLSNEFAVVGYRAHSMIHGEFELVAPKSAFTATELENFQGQGIVVEDGPGATQNTLVVPLVAAFGNPDLLQALGLARVLRSLSAEREYRNDEQIDNSLRSVLFQVPRPGVDPSLCGAPLIHPECYTGVVDLGAIDIERGRDHGLPFYNDLRAAYGLPRKSSFREITGEATESFPADPLIDPLHPLDDPNSLDFVALFDGDGPGATLLPPGTEAAVRGVRRTTLAARLKAIYGSVDRVDAFVGMVSERHGAGSELGELQAAIWKRQFEALRDGDRFFYAWDPQLVAIGALYDVDYRHTLAEIIRLNTAAVVPDNVFLAAG